MSWLYERWRENHRRNVRRAERRAVLRAIESELQGLHITAEDLYGLLGDRLGKSAMTDLEKYARLDKAMSKRALRRLFRKEGWEGRSKLKDKRDYFNFEALAAGRKAGKHKATGHHFDAGRLEDYGRLAREIADKKVGKSDLEKFTAHAARYYRLKRKKNPRVVMAGVNEADQAKRMMNPSNPSGMVPGAGGLSMRRKRDIKRRMDALLSGQAGGRGMRKSGLEKFTAHAGAFYRAKRARKAVERKMKGMKLDGSDAARRHHSVERARRDAQEKAEQNALHNMRPLAMQTYRREKAGKDAWLAGIRRMMGEPGPVNKSDLYDLAKRRIVRRRPYTRSEERDLARASEDTILAAELREKNRNFRPEPVIRKPETPVTSAQQKRMNRRMYDDLKLLGLVKKSGFINNTGGNTHMRSYLEKLNRSALKRKLMRERRGREAYSAPSQKKDALNLTAIRLGRDAARAKSMGDLNSFNHLKRLGRELKEEARLTGYMGKSGLEKMSPMHVRRAVATARGRKAGARQGMGATNPLYVALMRRESDALNAMDPARNISGTRGSFNQDVRMRDWRKKLAAWLEGGVSKSDLAKFTAHAGAVRRAKRRARDAMREWKETPFSATDDIQRQMNRAARQQVDRTEQALFEAMQRMRPTIGKSGIDLEKRGIARGALRRKLRGGAQRRKKKRELHPSHLDWRAKHDTERQLGIRGKMRKSGLEELAKRLSRARLRRRVKRNADFGRVSRLTDENQHYEQAISLGRRAARAKRAGNMKEFNRLVRMGRESKGLGRNTRGNTYMGKSGLAKRSLSRNQLRRRIKQLPYKMDSLKYADDQAYETAMGLGRRAAEAKARGDIVEFRQMMRLGQEMKDIARNTRGNTYMG